MDPKDMGKIRKQLGLTQSQLAKISNVSQSLIAKVEAGKVDPSYSKAKALFETLRRMQRSDSRKAGDIMTRDLICVSPFDKVEHAAKTMHDKAISQLLVCEGERPIGNISEKTILRLLAEGGDSKDVFSRKVGDVMDELFPTVSVNAPVEIIYTMLDFFQAVLVTQRDKAIGIITKADLLKL